MRRQRAVLFPALLGAAWLLSFFAPVLAPGRSLANRDVARFHLPLRASFRELAAFGLPEWSPWLHGGQPVLSNPSYASFYPPSWLVFAVPRHRLLGLLAVVHGALAFAGAWRLARRLGCGRGAAALAAVGYLGCGAYVSLLSAFTLFCSLAWLPWLLAWADRALRAERREPWVAPALLAGGALALQLLNGEPSTVIMSGLALVAFAVSAAVRRPAAGLRVLVPLLLGPALAAVQLVPTLGRLADSSRQGLSFQHATLWSMPPQRAIEILFPRFFGDPSRYLEGLFFGWSFNDRNYPYVESLYPGLLLAVLAAAALLRWGIPRRAAWVLSLAAGAFLALGRHNPLYATLREWVPALAVQRFPEKYAVLAVAALVFAGALGWQWLLDRREEGRAESADLPLAIALVALATALGLALVLALAPRTGDGFIAAYGDPSLGAKGRGAGLAFLRMESWAAVAVAAAVAFLLALCRWRRTPRLWLHGLALLLLAADLWHYGHGLVKTLPAEAFEVPPPLAASLLPPLDRVYVQPLPPGAPGMLLRRGDPREILSRSALAEVEPYSGLLWNIPYAFHSDFDLMLTGWGRRAQQILEPEWRRPQRAYRYLGVWNVGTLLLRRKPAEWAADLARDPEAAPLRKVANTYRLPRFRFVPRVTFHASHAAALAAARAGGWEVGFAEHCVRPGGPAETAAYARPPLVLGIADEGSRIHLRYQAERGAFLVVAMTFDRGWRAFADGRPLTTHPTAACQLGVALPPGGRQLLLEYRDPLVPLGAGVSLAALGITLTAAAIAARARRRRPFWLA